jgi:hypothetical protein
MRLASLLALCLGCAGAQRIPARAELPAPSDELQLGGPDASAPVASIGTWVPAQAARATLLGGLPGVTGGAARSRTFVATNSTANGDGLVLASTVKVCWTTTGAPPCTSASYLAVNTSTGILAYPGNASFNTIDTASNQLTANALKVPVVHGSSTAAQAIESGSTAMTGGALAVTFSTAFGAAPACSCAHVNTTNSNACVISVAPSTTAVTFAATSGGTDVVNWFCIGQR